MSDLISPQINGAINLKNSLITCVEILFLFFSLIGSKIKELTNLSLFKHAKVKQENAKKLT